MIERSLYKTRGDGVRIYRTTSKGTNGQGRVRCDQTVMIYYDAYDVESSTATYTEVMPTIDPTAIPYWRLPASAEEGYSDGDRVVFRERIWESYMDHNACMPGDFGWNEIYHFPTFDGEEGAE